VDGFYRFPSFKLWRAMPAGLLGIQREAELVTLGIGLLKPKKAAAIGFQVTSAKNPPPKPTAQSAKSATHMSWQIRDLKPRI
jgi:hypothetical protein